MSTTRVCDIPRDTGYLDVCHICGIPKDAGYFDVAAIKKAPESAGEEVELARYQLHPQYCGVLLHFAQYAEPATDQDKQVFKTPGYEWTILSGNVPLAPYLPTDLILNPWGYNAFPIYLRLEEGCLLRLVVRKVAELHTRADAAIKAADSDIPVKGLLSGWPNTGYLRIHSAAREELVLYTGIDTTVSPHKFTGVRRGQKGTRARRWGARAGVELATILSSVGGRLVGRYWYNDIYGGTPNRL